MTHDFGLFSASERCDEPRIIVLTAPSGTGKTTIARRVLETFPEMRFSVSATTRAPRPHETDGVDYHFVSEDRFLELVRAGEMLEYEEVYPGVFYGTLRSDVGASSTASPVLLDIDVRGALSVKAVFGVEALTIFIAPPDLDELSRRLRGRGTEDPHSLETRLVRAGEELTFADRFDSRVVNDDLARATAETVRLVRSFLEGKSIEGEA